MSRCGEAGDSWARQDEPRGHVKECGCFVLSSVGALGGFQAGSGVM